MSDKWTALLKCPQDRFSNPVYISSDEFVVAPYNYPKQKSEGILKYNTTANKWKTIVKYPKDFQTSNCSLSFDQTEHKLYLIGAESMIYVVNLNTNKISKLKNGAIEIGVNPSSLFVEGELHLIGGSRNKKHILRNVYADDEDEKEKKSYFNEGFEFPDWVKGNQNCGLVYVRSKNQFVLLGGYNQYCEHKYSDMVWVYSINERKKKWLKKCKMPERACYFGYVLSADERYIILIGGYTSDKKVIKKIYVLDVDSMKFIKSPNISSPASGSVRATMGEDNYIYLFKHDAGTLWKISIESIVSGYSSTDDNYAYQLVKKYKKLLKESEMENRQIKIALNKLKQQNDTLAQRSKNKNRRMSDKKGGDSATNRKLTKKIAELQQQTQDQQTEIKRFGEKVIKYKRYINELESEKMKANNSNLQQRLKIKELQSRLYELEGDSAELGDIEAFLKRQEELAKVQEAAMAEIVADIDGDVNIQD